MALGHKRLCTLATLPEMVEREGYRPGTVEGIFLKPITTQQIQMLGLAEDILQAMLKVGVAYPELCVGILIKLEPVA